MDNLLEIKDYDIERAIITILVEDDNIRTKMTDYFLNESFFKNNISKLIFNEILTSIQEGRKIDFLLLKELLANKISNEQFEKYFTFNFFYPKKELFGEYVKILLKNHKRSELISIIEKIKNGIIKKDDQIVLYGKKMLEEFDFSIENDTNPEIGLIENSYLAQNIKDILDGKQTLEKKMTLYTGYKSIDEGIGGFEKGNYIIFAARPSVGKSIAMLNLMESMKSIGAKVMFFSGEMYARYVMRRIISINLGIDGDKLKFPNRLNDKERKNVIDFIEKMEKDKDRHIYYSPKMCALDIYQHARNIKKRYGLDAIFIDYIGKLYPNNGNMNRSRNDIVSDISRELYELAGALNVVVVTASQLSREGAKTAADGLYEPKLTDLRDSGSLEQDADIVIGISRDKEAAKHCILESDVTDFKMRFIKNRNGKLGDFIFNYYPVSGKITDKYENVEKNNLINFEKGTKTEENMALIESLIEQDKNAVSIIDDIFGKK